MKIVQNLKSIWAYFNADLLTCRCTTIARRNGGSVWRGIPELYCRNMKAIDLAG